GGGTGDPGGKRLAGRRRHPPTGPGGGGCWRGEAGGEHEQRPPAAAPHAAVVPPTSRPDNLTARQPAATIRRVRLVLASASPRRRELLGWLGIDFVIDAADVDERPRPGESAERLVRPLAAAQASAGA